ncbi:MAG: TetR/AcrR family transcriptional regulator [Bifidobacteriaceae bacterium]|jgi:AcrR family transcriptional regulator|nr:TetR/AcrR family transcriptional regulator [Bifidobacteriaceae bacterium]
MTRSRNVRGVAREQAILAAASRLFGMRGFRSVSLREVAAAAGITHSTLLHYFPSKEELLDAVLDAKDISIAERLRTGDRLTDVLGELKADNLNEPGLIALLMKLIAEATDAEHPAHERMRNRYEHIIRIMGQHLADDGQPIPEGLSIEDAARLYLAVSDGLNLQWLYSPNDLDPVRLSILAAQLILGASLPPTESP